MASSHILWISKTVIESIMDKTSRLHVTEMCHEIKIQWTFDISNPDNSNSKYMIALNLED